MKSTILEILKKHSKKSIALFEVRDKMPSNIPNNTPEAEFYKGIWELEDLGILEPKKNKGYKPKERPLYEFYNINKDKLNADYIKQIHDLQRKVSKGIDLKSYLKLSETTWKEDLPWIKQLDAYLKEKGMPQEEAICKEDILEIWRKLECI